MKFAHIMIVLVTACTPAAADTVPLPRTRPAPSANVPHDLPPAQSAVPSDCRTRLTSDVAIAPSLPPIVGPGECGGPDVVKLEAVVLPDMTHVAVTPPATLRCSMAEAVVKWVRDEAVPRALELGSALRGIQNYDSFDCRGRNRIPGAIISEHGKANALDIRSLKLADGRIVHLTDPQVPHAYRDGMRASMCGRFTTVLGPGSDGYHEDHIHVDLAQRHNGYRICHWVLHDPAAAPATAIVTTTTTVPLPPPRPKLQHHENGKP